MKWKVTTDPGPVMLSLRRKVTLYVLASVILIPCLDSAANEVSNAKPGKISFTSPVTTVGNEVITTVNTTVLNHIIPTSGKQNSSTSGISITAKIIANTTSATNSPWGKQNFSTNGTSITGNTGANTASKTISQTGKPDSTTSVPSWLIANLTIVFTGLTVNIFIVSVLLLNCWKVSTHYKLTTFLGISDGLYGLLFIMIQLPGIWYPDDPFALGKAFCKIANPLLTATILSDVGFIILLAIERFVLICYPMRGGLNMKLLFGLVFGNVMFAVISVLPYVYYSCESSYPPMYFRNYSIYFFVVGVAIPITILVVLYWQSIAALKRVAATLVCSNNSAKERRHQENKRILVIIISLVVMFFIMLTPTFLFYLLMSLGVQFQGDSEKVVHIITENVFPIHTIVNPIIYSLVDRRVRRIILTIFFRKGRRRDQTSSRQTNTTVF